MQLQQAFAFTHLRIDKKFSTFPHSNCLTQPHASNTTCVNEHLKANSLTFSLPPLNPPNASRNIAMGSIESRRKCFLLVMAQTGAFDAASIDVGAELVAEGFLK